MEEFSIRTSAKCEVVDITAQVAEAVAKLGTGSRKRERACLVYVPHTTCGITVNEYEPNIARDYPEFFSKIAPPGNYRHNLVDNNAEAHLLSAMIKPDLLIPIDNGRLALGRWQRILLVEGDGPRERKVCVQVLK